MKQLTIIDYFKKIIGIKPSETEQEIKDRFNELSNTKIGDSLEQTTDKQEDLQNEN